MNVLTVPDFDEFKTRKPGINDVSKRVIEGIERAKKYQDIVRAKVLNGDMPLYKLDILVAKVKQQLKSEGVWKEPFSAHVDNWIKSQERFEWVVNIGGTLVGIGLAIGAFFTGGTTAILLGLAGGAAGVGVAGYDFEMADDVVDAARSGKGGKEQLVNDQAAELNYLFATVNLFLSVIDLALAAKNATELVKLVKVNKGKLGIEATEEILGDSVESSVKNARTANVVENIPGVVQSRINIANGRTRFTPIRPTTGEPVSAGFDHVLQQHFNRQLANSRSIFSITPEELKSILQRSDVVRTPVRAIAGGQYVRAVNVGKTIGNEALKFGGKKTTWIEIFTDRAGNLITTYPIPAS